MTTLDEIIITNITGQIDEMAQSLAGVPGRTPQDAQIAATLLNYTTASIYASRHGDTPQLMLNSLTRRGVDADEARAIAQALKGLALRLGAWLGRQSCEQAIGAVRGAGTATEDI